MGASWPGDIAGIPVKRAPLGANRSDQNATTKNLLIIHDIEGSASSALGLFASPGDPREGGGSTQFVADPGSQTIWQLVSCNDVAYGCGNYQHNQRAIQIELPGFAGRPYPAAVLDYASRFLAWGSKEFGIPLTFLDLAALNRNPNAAGVTGHQFIPNPNNPSQGGGKDGHGDPGGTFPWTDVISKAVQYRDNLPGPNPGPPPDNGTDLGGGWPTGFRIDQAFRGYWASCGKSATGGYDPAKDRNIAVATALFGYPISRGFIDEGTDPHIYVQYFERARFEQHPDGRITLGLLGAEDWNVRKAFLPDIASTREV